MLLHAVLERTARFFPEKEGMVFNGLRFTYCQLQDRVSRLAWALSRLGIKKGDRIASLMDNSHCYFEFFFATAQIGAVAIPVNHRLSASEIEYILRDSGASALFISDRFLSIAENLKDRNEEIRNCIFIGRDSPSWALDYEELITPPFEFPSHQGIRDEEGLFLGENDTAVILYTSGTTGKPKGVMLTHRNLLSTITSLLFSYPFTSQDRYCNQGPLFHIGPLISMLSTTISGATHIFMDSVKPEATLETIEKEKVTMIMMAPTMLHRLINHQDIKHKNLNSIRLIGYGGAPIPMSVIKKAMEYLRCDYLGSYGTTETAGYLTILTPDDHRRGNLLTSCGREVYGVKIRIVNENGEDVEDGEIGEIVVKTNGLMKGYLNKIEETKRVIKDGWFYTGDMAKRDGEGYIYIADRKKDMIITGGENVYSAEVENIIITYKGIEEAAVIGIPDEDWGEVVTAVVVPSNGSHLTENEIIEYCKERATHYKCPKKVIFRKEIPKNSFGKILKRELKTDIIR